jgi:tRNA(Arg) A34 adenosine deaminase TadA
MSGKSRKALEKWLTKFPLPVQQKFMEQSIELATAAGLAQEIPVGAIVVDGQGQIIGRGENRREAIGI